MNPNSRTKILSRLLMDESPGRIWESLQANLRPWELPNVSQLGLPHFGLSTAFGSRNETSPTPINSLEGDGLSSLTEEPPQGTEWPPRNSLSTDTQGQIFANSSSGNGTPSASNSFASDENRRRYKALTEPSLAQRYLGSSKPGANAGHGWRFAQAEQSSTPAEDRGGTPSGIVPKPVPKPFVPPPADPVPVPVNPAVPNPQAKPYSLPDIEKREADIFETLDFWTQQQIEPVVRTMERIGHEPSRRRKIKSVTEAQAQELEREWEEGPYTKVSIGACKQAEIQRVLQMPQVSDLRQSLFEASTEAKPKQEVGGFAVYLDRDNNEIQLYDLATPDKTNATRMWEYPEIPDKQLMFVWHPHPHGNEESSSDAVFSAAFGVPIVSSFGEKPDDITITQGACKPGREEDCRLKIVEGRRQNVNFEDPELQNQPPRPHR